jgi:predicted nucleic acid-binding protein
MTDVARVYLDTNVFIAIKEVASPAADLLVSLIAVASRGDTLLFVTSELTLAEVLTKPYVQNRQNLIDHYESTIRTSTWLSVSAVDREVLRPAAIFRSLHRGVKLPDAVHLATALAAHCSHVLTADEGLKGRYSIADARWPELHGAGLTIIRPDIGVLQNLLTGSLA